MCLNRKKKTYMDSSMGGNETKQVKEDGNYMAKKKWRVYTLGS